MKSKELIISMAEQFTELFIKDLEAIPDGNESKSWGGTSRSAIQIAAECVEFINSSTNSLDKAQMELTQEGFAASEERIKSKQQAIEELREANRKFVQKVESLSDEQLAETVTAPWGTPLSRANYAAIVPTHTFYHDGQLNYIQTLYGDKDTHWM